MKKQFTIISLMLWLLAVASAEAQITIGGNVYGGGNAGDLKGRTDVIIYQGDIHGVFGGARMANVEGSASLNIDGDNSPSYILIDKAYGGNDIAGSIGTSTALPDSLTQAVENGVDNTWNAFVRISSVHTKTTGTGTEAVTTTTHNKVYIGQLFGGGNGEYTYSAEKENGKYDVTVDGQTYTDITKPELAKTYLEVVGGSIVYAYGGGNNATVTNSSVICVDNPSDVVNHIIDATNPNADTDGELLTDERFVDKMDINTGFSYPSSDAFQIGRFFGGNNVAPMAIRPTWHLKSGRIRNVYSGGNRGDMTSPVGLLLEIPTTSQIVIDNLYGGCRMADVHPKNGDDDVDSIYIQLTDVDEHGDLKYHFPAGLAARVLVRGGDVNNVYGGNDVTGIVYGGNAVGVYTSIRGDIYGGGNGSYPYTDNSLLENHQIYGDVYYGKFKKDKGYTSSIEALNAFRPHAEQVSIRIAGTSADKPVIIGGSVYCGGNSATLKNTRQNPMVELKIGSYVIADKVFLGNNGENMIKNTEANDILQLYTNYIDAGGNIVTSTTEGATKFTTLSMTDSLTFASYMDGCAMAIMPRLVFDNVDNGDPATYIDYTAYIGSLYCGGNVGSMTKAGLTTMNFDRKIVIFDKVVGGCNDAYVAKKDGINAEYIGGVIGTPEERAVGKYEDVNGKIKDRLVLNFSNLKIQPKRWRITTGATPDPEPSDNPKQLVWNTVDANGNPTPPVTFGAGGVASEDDLTRRFAGGNIYGGCYTSGRVNGNVVINLNNSLVDRDRLFDDVSEDEEGEAMLYGHDSYTITKRHTGVLLSQQGMDVLGKALNVFGGGKGGGTEIWGSTTINLNAGYTFQIFGGSEEGVIGRSSDDGTYTFTYTTDKNETVTKKYKYDPRYSCYVNLRGENAGVSKKADQSEAMAECEFMYGGGFLGPIAGNTIINLGKGRIFNSFAGSCNADILGHTETYIGRQVSKASVPVGEGFPWIRDIVYGGNDLGGRIMGDTCFKDRVRTETLSMVHPKKTAPNEYPDVLYASAYVEYLQGRADGIFGGCYGTYDYTEPRFRKYTNADGSPKAGFTKPRLNNAFVNFRPSYTHVNNVVKKVYGAGQGQSGEADRDKMQNRSYVLIDIPQSMEYYKNMEVFGAGAWGGVGMGLTKAGIAANPDSATAIIDLVRGQISAAYGASYKEGFTRRTLVNVPRFSTININNIFGGGYGIDEDGYRNEKPCDAYEAHVEFHSDTARVTGAIYGGNNSYRRTLYGFVNISAPVWSDKSKGYLATVYGAGLGENTWSQYTEINLTDTAQVYEVYGGGKNGKVLNKPSVAKWKTLEAADSRQVLTTETDTNSETALCYDNGLNNALAKAVDNDYVPEINGKKYNTNVHIHKGATVVNYAYGGGLGDTSIQGSGDVYGTTYIDLLGGTVNKDIYAAGTVGGVKDSLGIDKDDFNQPFKASANAYIEGGTLRNVYGGGWKGDVGRHDLSTNETTNDIPGETNVIIGIRPDQGAVPVGYGFYKGIPAIQRNAYSGGEGGAVFGNANLVLNNGAIGYEYDGVTRSPDNLPVGYKEKLNDETYKVEGVYAGEGRLKDCGNVFGGGYDVRSSVDKTNVTIWSGVIRNSVHGGGEIATIGRGAITASGQSNSVRTLTAIYNAGKTHVEINNGHVLRNVFGGGKGYNIWGYGQQGTLYTDGYVFGQTEVYIHGGEVGTKDGVALGYGNVFGGGDIGYIYSKGYFDNDSRKISTGSPGHTYYYDNGKLIEDCKVVIAPKLQVSAFGGATINNHPYKMYAYVDTDDLNTLPKKNADGTWTGGWEKLFTVDDNGNDRGIIIHNGVFGGGNVSSNSDKTYANAITVYGNTTATLYDVYHRDFITVGTEHTGGLYGGGNLSLVDGYRELNITNYGTDYYGLDARIDLPTYRSLSNRERAYFQLEYVCTGNTETSGGKNGVTIGGEFYEEGQHLTEEKYLKLIENYPNASQYWEPFGFCSIYAGRLLNTIQRADFCGVYGSRMVLQGAKDRVADIGENIDYTINRVGEVSLNKKKSVRTAATVGAANADTGDDAEHGNYFGIYSLVNCMGNLTSDVHFQDTYIDPAGVESEDGTTFYSYKKSSYTSKKRNKGKSINQVALASGVFLELTTENSTEDHKKYGLVTGVVGLDLINVKTKQEGGGFVYAKNEHRIPRYYPNKENVLLSEYNKLKLDGGVELRDEARTYKRYRYSASDAGDWSSSGSYSLDTSEPDYKEMPYETSGNFIHHKKDIIDDCYPTNNAYIIGSANYSEAHYWYVKGDVYIYDQKLSAYTGSATAYSKEVHLPLTITAASHGKLQLLNVKPNLYAYYMPTTDADNQTVKAKIGTVKDDNNKVIDKVTVNNEMDSYELNDVISWWDWHQLPARERQYFVAQTYVNTVTVKITENNVEKEYAPGSYVMDETDFTAFKTKFTNNTITVKTAAGETLTDITKTFRSSNNISHEAGYVLTLDMNTPRVWDDYYTATTGTTKKTKEEYNALFTDGMTEAEKDAIIKAWHEGPTFTPVASGVYGQRQVEVGQIFTKDAYDSNATGTGDQAVVERAYVATETVSYTYGGNEKTINAGTAIPKKEYDEIGDAKNSFAAAWLCTSTVKLTNENYLLYGELKTESEITAMKTLYPAVAKDIEDAMTQAYICRVAGGFGGQQFDYGTNYSAVKAWCSLPVTDRYNTDGTTPKFNFNYDGFDLLTDTDYLTVVGTDASTPTTARTAQAYHSPYTDAVQVEYQAVFQPDEYGKYHKDDLGNPIKTLTYDGGTLSATNAVISNTVFETKIRNDKRHYTRVSVKAGGETVYIATSPFTYLGIPYGKGQLVDVDVYTANADATDSKVKKVQMEGYANAATVKYYCYDAYDNVPVGDVIDEDTYNNLVNDQQYFVIQGMEPTERTTLYVSRESDAQDVTKEKIISVIYQYTYYEDEDEGGIKMTNELHVINVHLQLESGVPTIGQLNPPGTVLPGNAVGLKAPEVNPGLYEILTSGWELFTNEDDALNHRNGVPFTNNTDPVYWYQNQKDYVAFFSKTYLGKTYSNPVPLSVANYHDIDRVMKDKEHHLYVDKSNVDRPCKIYIDNRDCQSDATKSKLDLLRDFFDLSMLNGTVNTSNGLITTIKGSDPEVDSPFKGHALLGDYVAGGEHLEFFIRSDVSPKAYTAWTPIANAAGQCFQGNLHGDGYTISGLDHSLFGNLCGKVYNLGVTGTSTFRGSGIANGGGGRVENCWFRLPAGSTVADDTKAIFGGTDGTVVNSYYDAAQNFTARDGATAKSATAFYNGEVAYNLNGFYLNKRFYDHRVLNGSPVEYKYLTPNADGTLPETMTTGSYPSDYALYRPTGTLETPYLGYVEHRFYDGDYRYAGGSIPESNDIRMRTVTVTQGTGDDAVEIEKTYYVPIWPDDYLFFGQALNYGHMDGENGRDNRTHQDLPSRINKSGDRLLTTISGNRVNRAPAYFRSKDMGVAHFNPYAVFAQSKNGDATQIAYKNMTAIDFTGGNGDVAGGYDAPAATVPGGTLAADAARFYPPLLDDSGLSGIYVVDLTRNLLVYTDAPSDDNSDAPAGKTAAVVSTYLHDQPYAETNDDYHTVAVWDRHVDNIHGHWVARQSDGDYVAPFDHMLVDLQEFNSPIGYIMGDGKRMWYQRTPDNYAGQKHNKDGDGNIQYDGKSGWESVCLPFQVDLVTTQTKGELTHFYNSEYAGLAAEMGRTGHEYWLRECTDITKSGNDIATANFTYPDAIVSGGSPAGSTKDYTNTFLWDHYYQYGDDARHDRNSDSYQQYYQLKDDNYVQHYVSYPRQQADKPYIIGFPGSKYYEFDLSGDFEAKYTNTNEDLTAVPRQVITFASAESSTSAPVTIGVSDDELLQKKTTFNGFTFYGNYLNIEAPVGHYVMNADGNSYEKVTTGTKPVLPFRTYFSAAEGLTRSIVFSNEQSQLQGDEQPDLADEEVGTLSFVARDHKIIATSSLRFEAPVRITTLGGVTVSAFTIQPGETIETPVNIPGVYIVNKKKLMVK